MSGGHVLSQDDVKQPPRIVAFDRYALDLDAFDQKISDDKDLRPRERYYSELVNPDPESRFYKRNPGQFRAELHERFASPLYPLAFVFIALAAAGAAQSTRTNRTRSIVMGFAAGAGLRLAGLGLNNPGQSRTSRILDQIGVAAAGIAARLRPGTAKTAGST
jgi:lipopolysaccharide export system permease protein